MATPAESPLHTVPGIDAEQLSLAIMRHTADHFGVLDLDLKFIACNDNLARTLGWRPEEMLGRPGLDLVDPSHVERAARALALVRPYGSPSGVSILRLRRGDGSAMDVHISATDIDLDGTRVILLSGRPVYLPGAVDRILDGLLGGAPVRELLEPVIECFAWRENESGVAICWSGDDGGAVDTGLPPTMTGALPGGPWDEVRRTRVAASGDVEELDGPLGDDARSRRFLHYWIEPVEDARGDVPALVTVWTSVAGYPPEGLHAAGMADAKRYVELATRWTDQVQRLEVAAHHDELTGLANRRRFFEAIDGAGERGGVVLYRDLDGFKPVNDRWGHAAGDRILAEVGRRIARTVRDGDLVARLGGDEFAVVLWSAGPDEADGVARRIRAACTAPIPLGDDGSGDEVTVGISIGIARDPHRLSAATVEQADAALYADKVGRQVDRLEGSPG